MTQHIKKQSKNLPYKQSLVREKRRIQAASQKSYEDLKAAKEEEIAAGQAQLDAKTQEIGRPSGRERV